MTASRTPSSALMPTYARYPEAFTRGDGMYLYDGHGRRYLDFYAGIGVMALGHCHPHLVAALRSQAGALWHVSNLFHIEGQERLAQRLADGSFADRVFFTNSGTEALEGMIKLARRCQYVRGYPGRRRIITVSGAFHGRTLASLAAAGNPKYMEGFAPHMEGFDQTPLNNLNALRAAITPETAAILVEPVQGEGGIRVATPDFLRGLRAAADEFGLLLLLDEVQCGNGRTGHMWAHEQAGVTPDALATAKGLGGGFPVGAILATEAAAAGMTPGTHGSTFGGNPLAMAAGNAVLDILLADGFLAQVRDNAALLRTRLEELVHRYPGVFVELRGTGLMLGLKCNAEAGISNLMLIDRLRTAGLLTVGAADNVIRLLPPLILQEMHVAEAMGILETVADAVSSGKES